MDDDELQLSEALTFFNNIETDGILAGNADLGRVDQASDHSVWSDVEGAANALPTIRKPAQTKRKRKYRRGYSTELLRRKKFELQTLRDQAQELEDYADMLRRGSVIPKLSAEENKDEEKWSVKALQEFKKRRQSETVNRRLKAIKKEQTEVRKSLLAVIQQKSTQADMTFILNEVLSSSQRYQITETHDNSMAIAQLKDNTEMLYQSLEDVVPQQEMATYRSEFIPKLDPIRGNMFESLTASAVPCSMEKASESLWKEYNTPIQVAYKSYRYMNPVGPNSVTKSFDLLLCCQRGVIHVNGLMFAHRFQERGRMTMVRAYVVLLPSSGLYIRCHHWTIVSAVDNDECRVQFFVQLFTEKQPGFLTCAEDVEYVQEVALRTWSLQMHSYSQRLLDRLLDKGQGTKASA